MYELYYPCNFCKPPLGGTEWFDGSMWFRAMIMFLGKNSWNHVVKGMI